MSGEVFEGEDSPLCDDAEALALRVFRLLANGSGGINWAGLPYVCTWLGITDVDALFYRLEQIRSYQPRQAAQDE